MNDNDGSVRHFGSELKIISTVDGETIYVPKEEEKGNPFKYSVLGKKK